MSIIGSWNSLESKNYVRMTDYEMQRVMLTHMFMVFQEACRSFCLHVQFTILSQGAVYLTLK